jgi:hypothetical protein
MPLSAHAWQWPDPIPRIAASQRRAAAGVNVQLGDYGPSFDNHSRLRGLITELEALSLAIAEADPCWNR